MLKAGGGGAKQFSGSFNSRQIVLAMLEGVEQNYSIPLKWMHNTFYPVSRGGGKLFPTWDSPILYPPILGFNDQFLIVIVSMCRPALRPIPTRRFLITPIVFLIGCLLV